jgi:hypothetical protein
MADSAINWLSVGGVLRRFEARTLRAPWACFKSNPGNRAKSSVNERFALLATAKKSLTTFRGFAVSPSYTLYPTALRQSQTRRRLNGRPSGWLLS